MGAARRIDASSVIHLNLSPLRELSSRGVIDDSLHAAHMEILERHFAIECLQRHLEIVNATAQLLYCVMCHTRKIPQGILIAKDRWIRSGICLMRESFWSTTIRNGGTFGIFDTNYLLTLLAKRRRLYATLLPLLHFVVSVERHNSDGHAIAVLPRSR